MYAVYKTNSVLLANRLGSTASATRSPRLLYTFDVTTHLPPTCFPLNALVRMSALWLTKNWLSLAAKAATPRLQSDSSVPLGRQFVDEPNAVQSQDCALNRFHCWGVRVLFVRTLKTLCSIKCAKNTSGTNISRKHKVIFQQFITHILLQFLSKCIRRA